MSVPDNVQLNESEMEAKTLDEKATVFSKLLEMQHEGKDLAPFVDLLKLWHDPAQPDVLHAQWYAWASLVISRNRPSESEILVRQLDQRCLSEKELLRIREKLSKKGQKLQSIKFGLLSPNRNTRKSTLEFLETSWDLLTKKNNNVRLIDQFERDNEFFGLLIDAGYVAEFCNTILYPPLCKTLTVSRGKPLVLAVVQLCQAELYREAAFVVLESARTHKMLCSTGAGYVALRRFLQRHSKDENAMLKGEMEQILARLHK